MNIEIPYPGLCKSRKTPDSQLIYCMVSGELPSLCHYSMTFGDNYLCLHPCNYTYDDIALPWNDKQ